MGVPQTVYSGPSTTVAKPKSPNFKDFVPLGYSHTYNTHIERQKHNFYPPFSPLDISNFPYTKCKVVFFTGFVFPYCCVCVKALQTKIFSHLLSLWKVCRCIYLYIVYLMSLLRIVLFICVCAYQQILRFDVSMDDTHPVQIFESCRQVEYHYTGISFSVFC